MEVILGLDLVELVIATEAAFGVAIPDAVAAELDTPRKVIDYLQSRLATSDTPDCLSQRAFYRIRGAVMQRFERSRDSLAPDTRIGDVLPHSGAEAHWRQLGAELGADQWPKWRDASWLRRQLGTGPATLGDLANQLARTNPAAAAPMSSARPGINAAGPVTRIDPAGNRVTARVPLDGRAVVLAAEGDRAWVATSGPAAILRLPA